MKDYTKYSVEDLAADSHFIHWVLNPDKNSNAFWSKILDKDAETGKKAEEAADLIRSLVAVEPEIPAGAYQKVWDKIRAEQAQGKKRSLVWTRWAAVLVLLIGTSVIFLLQKQTDDFQLPGAEIAELKEARVILQDGSVQAITGENSEISVSASGDVIVNKDTLDIDPVPIEKAEMIQVIMPYGKQSSLFLPDGTKVHLNAGSLVSFPSVFKGSKREVRLIGEAYFEVAHNKEKPFIVQTPDVKIKVYGTSFNVSAYSDDNFTQTVLVEGSLGVSTKKLMGREIKIVPGESAYFDKSTEEIVKDKVDTELYTSWINNYIICRNDPVASIVKRIERYYNQKIRLDQNLGEITFSGKLDLKNDLMSVLESVSYASELTIDKTDETLLIKKEN